MSRVDDIIDRVIGREGKYVNNPADTGGETHWGITEKTARRYGYGGSMKIMPREVAVQIYRTEYWSRPGFASVANTLKPYGQQIAEELLDTGVNMGQATATMFLQRSLNVLNRGRLLFPDVNVDGGLGPMTMAALQQFVMQRGAEGVTTLLKMLNSLQAVRYIEIAEKNPSQEEFVFGWITNRVAL